MLNKISNKKKTQAADLLDPIQCFEFTFHLHFMKMILGRTFSAMKFIKNSLCNKIGDKLMNNCLVKYIEKDIFDSINN